MITSGGSGYGDGAYQNDVALGVRLKDLKTPEEIKSIFPSGVKTASFEGSSGYINYDGGWAFASQGVAVLLERVKKLGAVVYPGKGVVDLIKGEDGKTRGVKASDGSSYDADLVVIASGSWTPSSFPKLNLYDKCLATGLVSLPRSISMMDSLDASSAKCLLLSSSPRKRQTDIATRLLFSRLTLASIRSL